MFHGILRKPAAELEQAIIDHMANKLFTKDRVKGSLKGIYAFIPPFYP